LATYAYLPETKIDLGKIPTVAVTTCIGADGLTISIIDIVPEAVVEGAFPTYAYRPETNIPIAPFPAELVATCVGADGLEMSTTEIVFEALFTA
jgi:hypothetical protein